MVLNYLAVQVIGAAFGFVSAFAWSIPAAFAAMPPEAYEKLLAAAPAEIVLAVEEARFVPAGEGRLHGACEIEGRVIEVRRDRKDAFDVGMRAVVSTPCLREGASDVPVGGAVWTNFEALNEGTQIEAVLDPDGKVAGQGKGLKIED